MTATGPEPPPLSTATPLNPTPRASQRATAGIRRANSPSASTIQMGTVPTSSAAMPDGSLISAQDTTPLPAAGSIAPSSSIAAHCLRPGRSRMRSSREPERQPIGSMMAPAIR